MLKKKIIATLTTLAVATGATVIAAPSAFATGSACGGVMAEIDVCVTVDGSGVNVDYISGYTENTTSGTFSNLHMRLYGPNGTLYTSPTFTLDAYSTYYPNTEYYDENMPAGDYCYELYQGSSVLGVSGCVDVHS